MTEQKLPVLQKALPLMDRQSTSGCFPALTPTSSDAEKRGLCESARCHQSIRLIGNSSEGIYFTLGLGPGYGTTSFAELSHFSGSYPGDTIKVICIDAS